MAIGLHQRLTISLRGCRINLERPNDVKMIDSLPACVLHESAACVLGNTLYAVGIGLANDEVWKWNAASNWTRCANMTSGADTAWQLWIPFCTHSVGGCTPIKLR